MDMSTFGFDLIVMCTGIILVFFILVLLMFLILTMMLDISGVFN